MNTSREGFNLFNEHGRYHFFKYFPHLNWNLVWKDTFCPIWCKIVGHDKYDCSDMEDGSEFACRRCHQYVR